MAYSDCNSNNNKNNNVSVYKRYNVIAIVIVKESVAARLLTRQCFFTHSVAAIHFKSG